VDEIQYLDPGTKIRLIGDVPAQVEDNPRDGAWLVARFSHSSPALTATGSDRLRAADRESEHGLTFLRDLDTPDVLVIVHADDIVGVTP
jgi:hypothetical protein